MNKDDLRTELQSSRVAISSKLTDEERAAWELRVSEALLGITQISAAIADGQAIASYESYPSEPPTSAFNAAVVHAGSALWLPTFHDVDGNVTAELNWIDSGSGARCSSESLLTELAVVVVPAMAATVRGERIGKGRGYYDRFLAIAADSSNSPYSIALVRDVELLPEIPLEPHDITVDLAVGVPSPAIR